MQSAAARAHLATLEVALQKAPQPTKLTDHQYDQSHDFFERSSNQQGLILEWLTSVILKHQTESDSLKVLSVGCGSGILDNSLIKAIGSAVHKLEYTGVDPNEVACRRFRHDFEAMKIPNVDLNLRLHGIESLESTMQYDVIHLVHSLYYFDDPALTLCSLRKRLAPGGKIVVIQAPNEELNRLSGFFWDHHVENSIWFSDQLAEYFSNQGIEFSHHRIDGEVDVTRCFEADNDDGKLLLDFITQSDSSKFDEDVSQISRSYLQATSHSRNNRTFVSHPADTYILADH